MSTFLHYINCGIPAVLIVLTVVSVSWLLWKEPEARWALGLCMGVGAGIGLLSAVFGWILNMLGWC